MEAQANTSIAFNLSLVQQVLQLDQQGNRPTLTEAAQLAVTARLKLWRRQRAILSQARHQVAWLLWSHEEESPVCGTVAARKDDASAADETTINNVAAGCRFDQDHGDELPQPAEPEPLRLDRSLVEVLHEHSPRLCGGLAEKRRRTMKAQIPFRITKEMCGTRERLRWPAELLVI